MPKQQLSQQPTAESQPALAPAQVDPGRQVVETFTVAGGGYYDQVPGLILGAGIHTVERLANGLLRVSLGEGAALEQQISGAWKAVVADAKGALQSIDQVVASALQDAPGDEDDESEDRDENADGDSSDAPAASAASAASVAATSDAPSAPQAPASDVDASQASDPTSDAPGT